jgi:hypothetical protein
MASEVIERSMYGGQVNIVHNPNAKGRQPRYLVNGTEKPKGVTTIMGQTLAKDLISWAVGMCCDYLRTKLPVVTEEDVVAAGKAYMVRRDAGADTGSEAHALVENYLKAGTEPSGKVSTEAGNAYRAFVKWFEKIKPKVINVEEVIYSQKFKFAGTYDCMLEIDGKVVLCDLKTTNASRKAPNGVYAENFIQLGAYALAHEEQRQYEEAHGGTQLRKVEDLCVISAKKNGVLDIVTASDLGLSVEECGEMFKRVVNLYSFMLYSTDKLGGK